MSGGIFYTSDTHFCHKMVAGLRGFGSAGEHDEAVIANWNATVAPGDTVWHLGDVGLGKAAVILPCVDRLNGTIHLITGNHDAPWPAHRDSFRHQRLWLGWFATVQAFARRKIGTTHVLLSHFPYDGDHTAGDRASQYRLRDEGMWLLHGHTHGKERLGQPSYIHAATGPDEPPLVTVRGRAVHVGLDAWDLRPVAGEVIGKLIAAEDARREGAGPE